KYEHYGKIYMNVDMRAEVGLLTRNIVIESEVEEGENNGGHVKFLMNFKQVRVEGVELTKLGDPIELGRYPLHYHMCLDIGATGSYLRQNSIHHTFIRCTTIHGTFGAHVQDNTCYNYVGNGFFLEDGGEKNTTLEGNLAAVGYKGDKDKPLIPSDRQPSAFWITNPKTYVRNNAAAGGEGVGFFYVYPVEPIGLTKTIFGDDMSMFFLPDEARRTPIWEFDNNVAHSFHKAGLFIDNTLQPDGEVDDYNFYEPRVDPLDENSEWQIVEISRATGKNTVFLYTFISHVSQHYIDNGIGKLFTIMIRFAFDENALKDQYDTTGNRVYDGNSSVPHFTDINGDDIASLLDTDGSVTGIEGARVLRNYPFHVTSACTYRENWNLAVCPHVYGQVCMCCTLTYSKLLSTNVVLHL
ncbi:hypothetical protein FSP39_020921, partial [Pinctada imbricata]